MLRAGLTKLACLEKAFAKIRPDKRPKMMVVCEDTAVTPFVEQFLLGEGLNEDDILTVDSNKKGEVGEKEWAKLKGRLFGIDKSAQPNVILSVLMLREGFDVNNICVIVPLRASNAQILLEQTIGRGLRLMWREPEYRDVKATSRHQLLVERVAPDAVLDMLYIVEHPAFISFYERFLEEGLAGEGADRDREGTGTSDLLVATLKENYRDCDLFWPVILRECEEVLSGEKVPEGTLEPFTVYPLETLKRLFAKDGETFIGQELTVKTTFGEYDVHANLFNASSYNEYLQGIIQAISRRFFRVAGKQTRRMPALQVNLASIAEVIDRYIRNGLFAEAFDPFHESDWKVLLCANGIVTQHIIQQIGLLVHAIETGTVTTDASVRQVWFSSVAKIIVRESASLPLVKTIYTRTGYPAHGGGLERDFLDFVDHDSHVERFVKVDEARHTFARIAYLRTDGLMGEYIPDFLVATDKRVYVIETKATGQIGDGNVRQKQMAAIAWCKDVNALPSESRMDRDWAYVLLSEADFYAYRDGGGTILDMCAFAEVTEHGLKGEFDFS